MIFIKKVSYFKLTNTIMSIACFGFFAISSGFCNVNILNSNKAVSYISGNDFEYLCSDNIFSVRKNGNLVGLATTDKPLKIANYRNGLNFNGVAVAGAAAVGAMAAGAAITGGTTTAAVVATEAVATAAAAQTIQTAVAGTILTVVTGGVAAIALA